MTVALFVQYLEEQRERRVPYQQVNDVRSWLAKLELWRAPGDGVSISQSALVRAALRGYGRVDRVERQPTTPLPILLTQLLQVWPLMPLSWRMASTFAYACFLRWEEAVMVLKREATISLSQGGILVWLPHSKGDRTRRGVRVLTPLDLCAPELLQELQYMVREWQGGPPVDISAESGDCNACLKHYFRPADRVHFHSHRVGRVSELHAQGVADEVLMAAGRWKSKAVMYGYIHPLSDAPSLVI